MKVQWHLKAEENKTLAAELKRARCNADQFNFVCDYIANKCYDEPFTSRQISARGVFDDAAPMISRAMVREIIHIIRKYGLIKYLVASGSGYVKTQDHEKAFDYTSRLESRALSQLEIVSEMRKQIKDGESMNLLKEEI